MTASAGARTRLASARQRLRKLLVVARGGQAANGTAQSASTYGSGEGLERRLDQLEAALEGLQDAVHRNCVRHDAELGQLLRSTQPEQLARALSADARRRGI